MIYYSEIVLNFAMNTKKTKVLGFSSFKFSSTQKQFQYSTETHNRIVFLEFCRTFNRRDTIQIVFHKLYNFSLILKLAIM